MVSTAHDILADVLALPRGERAELASALIDSLDVLGEELGGEEWARAWLPELDRRSAEIATGEVKGVALKDALAIVSSAVRDARNS